MFAIASCKHRANKGIFITTSRFTDDARNYVSQIGSKIVLIDGEQLTGLMIEHDVGVSTVSLYPVKKLIAIILKRASNMALHSDSNSAALHSRR